MSQKEKLIKRLKNKPRDFTFEEAERLLGYFGYERFDKGRTQVGLVWRLPAMNIFSLFICINRIPGRNFWNIR